MCKGICFSEARLSKIMMPELDGVRYGDCFCVAIYYFVASVVVYGRPDVMDIFSSECPRFSLLRFSVNDDSATYWLKRSFREIEGLIGEVFPS